MNDFLADMLNVVGYSSERNVYLNTMYTGLQEKAYPPLTYMMMYFFSRLVDMEPYYEANYFLEMYKEPQFLIMYMIYATVGIVMVYELVRTCKCGDSKLKIFTAAAVCVSAPMIFSYERGNTIILTMFCEMFFIFYYDSDKRAMREFALIALAIATAFKMTPAVLGILLLYNRQWKEAARAVIYGIIIGILPFLFFDGGFSNLIQMFKNMQLNVDSYGSTEGATFTAAVVYLLPGLQINDYVVKLLQYITYLICAILFVAAPFYKNSWEKVLAVCMILIIAPSHSGQYCILYVIPAIIAFLNAQEHEISDWLIEIAFILIMQDIQSAYTTVVDYHFSIVVIVIILLKRAAALFVTKIKTRNKVREE